MKTYRSPLLKHSDLPGDDRATDILIDLLDSASIPIQTAAAETLGTLKTRISIRKMSEAMLDPQRSLNIKMLLAKALGNANNREAVEPLIKMLATDDRGLREVTKKSLEKITKQADGNDPAWWKQWWVRNKSKNAGAMAGRHRIKTRRKHGNSLNQNLNI